MTLYIIYLNCGSSTSTSNQRGNPPDSADARSIHVHAVCNGIPQIQRRALWARVQKLLDSMKEVAPRQTRMLAATPPTTSKIDLDTYKGRRWIFIACMCAYCYSQVIHQHTHIRDRVAHINDTTYVPCRRSLESRQGRSEFWQKRGSCDISEPRRRPQG